MKCYIFASPKHRSGIEQQLKTLRCSLFCSNMNWQMAAQIPEKLLTCQLCPERHFYAFPHFASREAPFSRRNWIDFVSGNFS